MSPLRLGVLVACLLTAAALLVATATADDPPKPPADDADSIFPVAASVPPPLRNVEVSLGDRKLKVPSIEYAQLPQGKTVYVMPVWVITEVEAFNRADRRWEKARMDRPLPTKADTPGLRLRVRLVNLLAQEDTQAAVVKRLQEHVARGERGKPEDVKCRFTTFKPGGYRISLAAPRTDSDAGEVALSADAVVPRLVAEEDKGWVPLDLLPESIAALQAANGGQLVLLGDTYLKLSGQMRARFEKQEYLANFQAVSTAVTALQNDLQSIQPTGQPAPEVFVQVPAGGTVEGKAAVTAVLSQHLVGSISVREGANVNPGLLSELAEKMLGHALRPIDLGQVEDGKRVSVMLGNMATLSATIGEIKTLAKGTKAEREKQLRVALDDMEARRTGRKSEYKGSVGVTYGVIGGKVKGAYADATEAEKATRRKRELETLDRGLDELAKHFDGRLPTLTGIRFNQKALDESVKVVQVDFQGSKFTTGWSQHDWKRIPLTGLAGPAVTAEMLQRQLDAARARYADFEKLLGSPKRLEEFEAAATRVKELEKQLQEQRRLNQTLSAELEKRLKGYKEVSVWMAVERVTFKTKGEVRVVSFSSDGKSLVIDENFGFQHERKVWNVATGKQRATIGPVQWGERPSPDGKTVAKIPFIQSFGRESKVTLRDVASNKERATLRHPDAINAVAFSPDGKTLATGGHDKTVRLWDVATGKEQAALKGHTDEVYSVAFSPDGKTLASGSKDKTIKFWDVATRNERATLPGHANTIRSLAFSPDGRTLASGSEDKTARLWDVASGTERATLKGHTNWVWSVAFSPDGKTLATGSEDKTIKLWDLQTYLLLGRPKPE